MLDSTLKRTSLGINPRVNDERDANTQYTPPPTQHQRSEHERLGNRYPDGTCNKTIQRQTIRKGLEISQRKQRSGKNNR